MILGLNSNQEFERFNSSKYSKYLNYLIGSMEGFEKNLYKVIFRKSNDKCELCCFMFVCLDYLR